MTTYTFNLNGKSVSVDAPSTMPMLWVLRDQLGVTGPKYGCGVGVCRACTSHLNGAAFTPCTTPVSSCAGKNVTTKIYNGAGHAFLADYRPTYREGPAFQLWTDITGYFDKHLKA